jgi:amino acid transporter
MAGKAGTLSLVSWVVGGVYTILTGLCFAECASRNPKAGGPYAFAHAAFGDLAGFMTGWTFWIGYVITIAAETIGTSLYLSFFLPGLNAYVRIIIATFVALSLTFVNFKGVKLGGKAEDGFTIGKVVPLLIFVGVGAFLINFQNYYPLLPANAMPLPAIGSATIFALWAYLGVEIITVPEEEIKDAKRVVPKAIIIAVFFVMSIYILISAVALGLEPWGNFLNAQAPLADVFKAATQKYIGNAGGIVIAVAGLISIVGSLNAVILGTGRISFAMARDELFPKILAHIHTKFKTPDVSMLVQTVIALILVFVIKDFTALASLAVMFTIVPYFMSCCAAIKMVKDAKWKTHVLHTRWIAFLAVAFSLALLFYFDYGTILLASLFISAGFGFYFFRKYVRSS